MQTVIAIAERHALLIVFLNVLLSQGGLPLPTVPTPMTAAALARQSPYQITQIILAGVSGALAYIHPQIRSLVLCRFNRSFHAQGAAN
jgi:membrane protein DedA with SNARE-associated domain